MLLVVVVEESLGAEAQEVGMVLGTRGGVDLEAE